MNKALVLISLCLFAGIIAASPLDHFNSLWSAWKVRHNKSYTGAENKARYEIFVENVKKIIKNNAEKNGVTFAINKFSDLTAAEFKKTYVGGSLATNQDNLGKKTLPFQARDDPLPDTFDWRTKGAVTRVKDQGQCGSCWTFSATGAIEGFYFIQNQKLISFSEQQIVDCDKGEDKGCSGGWHYLAIEYAGKHGLETETDYPYKARNMKCSYNEAKAIKTNAGYTYVTANNTAAFKQALVEKGPVSVAIQADQDVFQHYSRGVITSGCGAYLDHAVLTVGYTKVGKLEAFIVKNSWGSSWGDKGYVMISSLNAVNKNQGVCGILAIPVIVN